MYSPAFVQAYPRAVQRSRLGWTESGMQHLRVKVNMLERKGILEQANV